MTIQAAPPPWPGRPGGLGLGVDIGTILAARGMAELKVGTKLSDDVRQAAVGNSRLRILRPGNMATMDFVQDRINLIVDGDGTIIEIRCG